MRSHALLTAIGADRVGIVDDLSREILERSCNIEESRMALLGGDFAALLLISGEAAAISRLIEEAASIGSFVGLSAQARPTEAPIGAQDSLPYVLESTSLDSPGIVHSIAATLRRLGVNIADMETNTTPAPWTGAPMFVLRARLAIPKSLPIASFRRELQDLENEFNLDIKLISAANAVSEY